MPSITVTATANTPLETLWETWNNYPDIYLYKPGIKSSYSINASASTGLGAERQCDLKDGRNYPRERISVYRPQERMEIDIYESTLPMKSMHAAFDFKALGANKAQVTMTMTFVPKFGPLGWLMTLPMRPVMRRQLKQLLEASARYSETGETVNPPRVVSMAA